MQPLNNIFTGLNFFRIPVYQRGYSWELPQLEAFWNDIDNLMNNAHNHYMGMIGVERLNDHKKSHFEKWENFDESKYPLNNHNFFHIVDGQQRLSTIIILISQIKLFMDSDDNAWFDTPQRDLVKKYISKKPDINAFPFYYLGYEVDTLSNECLVRNILEDENVELEKNKYTSNMLTAKKFFNYRLEELKGKSGFQFILRKIFDILTTRLQFDFNEFKSEEISMIFETMNDRGKPLSNLEKLKNRLIYLTTILKEGNLVSQIDNTWAEVYKNLGKFDNYTSDEDDFFLNYHWILYYRFDKKEGSFQKKDIFERVFTVKNILSGHIGVPDILKYSESIKESIPQWFFIYNPRHKDNLYQNKEIRSLLNKLRYIGYKSFSPIILGSFVKNEPLEMKIKLLKIIEKHIFLLFYLSFRRADTGSYNFFARASQYHSKSEKTLEEIIKDIEFNWTYGLDREQDETASYIDPNSFYSYMRELFVRDNRYGYYSWSGKIGIKYFLMEYELSLNPNLDSSTIKYSDFHIELIFPGKTTKEGSEEVDEAENTEKEVETDTENFPEIDKEYLSYLDSKKNSITKEDANLRLKKLKYTLGNIVLVRKQYTKSERQTKFIDKKNSDFMNREMLENEKEVYKNQSWQPIDILKRGIHLLDFMEERWGFHFDSWKLDKRKVLFLDFIDPNQ